MRRLTIFLALSSLAAIGGTVSAAALPHAPSRPHTYRTVIHLSGDEYEDAQNNLLNNPRRYQVFGPARRPGADGMLDLDRHRPRSRHLHAQPTQPRRRPPRLDLHLHGLPRRQSHRQRRRGIHTGPITIDAITHANRYPATYTFTGGTGHFAGVTGVLIGTATTITVEVDPATGTAHSKFASKAVGKLTFPSKL